MVLHAPKSLFYFFAVLAFGVGPFIGGFITAARSARQKRRAFLFSSLTSSGLLLSIFILVFAFMPVLFMTSLNLPQSCNGTYKSTNPPPKIAYTFPDGTQGIVLNENATSLVATKIAYNQPSHPTHVYLIRRRDDKALWQKDFANDTVAVECDSDTAYVFNDALGYFIDTNTGERQDIVLSMDNYGYNDHAIFQTIGIMTIWRRDGSVSSLAHLYFSGIEKGCYITGSTSSISKL